MFCQVLHYNGSMTSLTANMPATVNNLQRDLFAKFRIAKTRVEWKKELEKCKYIPGTSTLLMINKFLLYCGKLQWPLPVQIEKFECILPMQLRQFGVSRALTSFAEVTESVKTFQELFEIDTVSHVFKNVTFNDVGCTLCNEPHKSLDCPSLRSIIEMEVSSSASPNHSSSSSDSDSPSPNSDFSSLRRRYRNGSRSTSRSHRRFDRGHSPEIDYSQGRDHCYCSPDRNINYRDRQYNPSYYDRRYNNSNGFSPARSYSQDRYPNQHQNRLFQNRYQGCNYRHTPNNNNNNGYDWNQRSHHFGKGQFRNQQQLNHNNQVRQNYIDHPASFNGNDRYMGHSNCNSTSSLSDVSSFVTRDSVTFDARRNQGFPNACTVK